MKNWSDYQVAVFDKVKAMSSEEPSALIVEAVAGSGKTTTIVEALRLISVRHRVVFLAFNKIIAEELKRRVPPNCDAATINSFGYRAVRGANRNAKVEQYKTRNALRQVVGDPEERRRWEGAISRLVGLRKATVEVPKDGPYKLTAFNELAARYDVEAPTSPKFMDALEQVWQLVIDDTRTIDFDDQWFHPIWFDLAVPQYDWCFVDEAQDLSSTQIELIRRIAPRIVAVGDPKQSIYGFRGSDPTAMQKMQEQLSAAKLPLSICYRCPKVVLDAANKVFGKMTEDEWDQSTKDQPDLRPFILRAPDAELGIHDRVDIKNLRAEAQPGSYVLCRTTAPLVKECLKLIVEGVKAIVKGRDIGQQICSLVDKVADGVTDIVEFTAKLEAYSAAETARLAAANRDAQLQALEDRVECIYALSEGARVVDDIYARVEKVFSDEAGEGITFATAHRTKGLEADDVYLLCPELMPFPKAKTEWAKEQELNLFYVATTRARKRLRVIVGGGKK